MSLMLQTFAQHLLSLPRKSSIARQFIVYILLFSMVITTVLTAIQLYLDYRIGVEQIHEHADLVKRSYLQSITNSVWSYDTAVLKSLAEGLSEIPDVIYIEIRDRQEKLFATGHEDDSNAITETFPLIFRYDGKDLDLGSMKIVFTLNNLYQQLLQKVVVIAITQGVKTLLVSLFIFFIFYWLVGRHLTQIADYANRLKTSNLYEELKLDKNDDPDSEENEIDKLAYALNSMRHHFRLYQQQIEQDRHELDLFKKQIEQSRDCIYIVDPETARILEVNQAVSRLLGFSRQEMLAMKAMDFSSTFSSLEDWQKFIETVRDRRDGILIEGYHRTKDGQPIPIEASAKMIDVDGEEIYIAFVRDITERHDAQKILKFQAQHDQLTNLPNRSLLNHRIETMIGEAKTDNRKIALLFIDLDHFKHINDSYGHGLGDKVLLAVANRLNECLSKQDTLARLGGDEFVALTALQHSTSDASILAYRLINSLREPFEINGIKLVINTSIGISVYPKDSENAEHLLSHADAAMYKAKFSGRNNFKFYSPDLTEQAEKRIQMEHDISEALKNHEFTVYFQPQMDSRKQCVIGAEALVRWTHPEKGFISPADFIPIAELTGQVNLIDQWVFRHTAAFISEARENDINLPRISVNFSGRDFELQPLSNTIPDMLRATGCSADRMEIEITETQLMENPETTINELTRLKQLGLSIAIDDFGTGYSSLSHLKQMPISKLKIDQAFVQDVCEDKNDRAIVNAIIALGQSLDIELIAEGVETLEQQNFLSEQGCHQVQGYLHSRPLPRDEFIDFIRQHPVC